MLPLIRRPIGPGGRRRGVTLVEMLVVVALVVLMMVILVQIFQVATGAISASRTIQELDVTLRQADSIIRSDLAGVTAKMTPPNNPADKRGYFEYGENAPADLQGEDSDDYLAFTTRAPEGQVFSGRQWLIAASSGQTVVNQNVQPTTITSQVAEVIYFLRNGNLYRRVFLVVPERVQSINVPSTDVKYGNYLNNPIFGGSIRTSWQGMNDISCRPGGLNAAGIPFPPAPNDLGSLTNRENRAFRPRFGNDFVGTATGGDGIADDANGDGLPDYYPTLYTDGNNNPNFRPNLFVNDGIAFGNGTIRQTPSSHSIYAFPFIYPGMYSVPDPNRVGNDLGWVHHMYPGTTSTSIYGASESINAVNHSPLDLGDNLVGPTKNQTWWGFPTWRETMTGYTSDTSVGWTDPVRFVNDPLSGYTQPIGLIPFPPTAAPNINSPNFLPPVTTAESGTTPYGTDPNTGSNSFVAIAAPYSNRVWEDELLLTGVRSFDVKAYDLNAPLYNTLQNNEAYYFSAGYQDLGYGSTYYNLTGLMQNGSGTQPNPSVTTYNYLYGPNGNTTSTQVPVPVAASHLRPDQLHPRAGGLRPRGAHPPRPDRFPAPPAPGLQHRRL